MVTLLPHWSRRITMYQILQVIDDLYHCRALHSFSIPRVIAHLNGRWWAKGCDKALDFHRSRVNNLVLPFRVFNATFASVLHQDAQGKTCLSATATRGMTGQFSQCLCALSHTAADLDYHIRLFQQHSHFQEYGRRC